MAETLTAVEQVKNTAIDLGLRFGPKLFTALVIFVVGIIVSRWAAHVCLHGLERIQLEPPVRALLARIARASFWGVPHHGAAEHRRGTVAAARRVSASSAPASRSRCRAC